MITILNSNGGSLERVQNVLFILIYVSFTSTLFTNNKYRVFTILKANGGPLERVQNVILNLEP